MRKAFPNATVIASTLDAYVEELYTVKDLLPVITYAICLPRHFTLNSQMFFYEVVLRSAYVFSIQNRKVVRMMRTLMKLCEILGCRQEVGDSWIWGCAQVSTVIYQLYSF